MQDALMLGTLSLILFFGVILSKAAKALRIPSELLLISFGIVLRAALNHGQSIFVVSESFLRIFSTLALTIVCFDSFAQLRKSDFDTNARKITRAVLISIIITITVFTATVTSLIGTNVSLALLLATLAIGIGSYGKKHLPFLDTESRISRSLAIVLPFIALEFLTLSYSTVMDLEPLGFKLAIGIGSGIFLALVLFKLAQHIHSELYAPLALTAFALLSYALGMRLGGIGILSVAMLGLFLGNAYAKQRFRLLESDTLVESTLRILVFSLAGLVLPLPSTAVLAQCALLFAVLIALRFIGLWIGIGSRHPEELITLTLGGSKSLANATVLLFLFSLNMPLVTSILPYATFLFLATLITATVTHLLHENHPHRY